MIPLIIIAAVTMLALSASATCTTYNGGNKCDDPRWFLDD